MRRELQVPARESGVPYPGKCSYSIGSLDDTAIEEWIRKGYDM